MSVESFQFHILVVKHLFYYGVCSSSDSNEILINTDIVNAINNACALF